MSVFLFAALGVDDAAELSGKLLFDGKDGRGNSGFFSYSLKTNRMMHILSQAKRGKYVVENNRYPTWLPDKKLEEIIFSKWNETSNRLDLYKLNMKAKTQELILADPGLSYYFPQPSNNGKYLGLVSRREEAFHLVILSDLQSQYRKVKIPRVPPYSSLSWSHDDNTIAVVDEKGRVILYKIFDEIIVIADYKRVYYFAFSPVEDVAAYVTRDGRRLEMMELSKRKVFSTSIENVASFAWSPSGDYIAYVQDVAREDGNLLTAIMDFFSGVSFGDKQVIRIATKRGKLVKNVTEVARIETKLGWGEERTK